MLLIMIYLKIMGIFDSNNKIKRLNDIKNNNFIDIQRMK